MILKKFSLVLQMCPLLPIWISKNICKNTKPCEFTFVKNKLLLALYLQQILRTLKMPECLKPKNIQSLNWILLVLIKTSTKFVHSCVIQTKLNKFKQALQSQTKSIPYNFLKYLKILKFSENPLKTLRIPKPPEISYHPQKSLKILQNPLKSL